MAEDAGGARKWRLWRRARLGGWRIERRFLRSRVARRVFFSVVVCALLPITIFAVLAIRTSSAQLRAQTEDRLQEEAKRQGMAVLERLLLLETALRLLGTGLADVRDVPAPDALPEPLAELARRRFDALRFVAADETGPLRELDARARSQLRGGGSVLRVVEDGSAPAIELWRTVPGPEGPRILAGRVSPRFLFVPEGLRADVQLTVREAGGGTLYASSALAPDPGGALAGDWELFLSGLLRAPAWEFRLREPAGVAMAPVRDFSTLFSLVALLALLGVGLATLVLVRRSLVPIEVLQDATRRMEAHDFSARVSLRSGDEFQDLARSFNRMGESIEHHVGVMRTVNGVGRALSTETDRERLLATILRGAMAVTHSDAGALHLADADEGVTCVALGTVAAGAPDRIAVTTRIDDDAAPDVVRMEALARQDCRTGRASCSPFGTERVGGARSEILSLPMRNHEHEVIGVLQLVARERPEAEDPEERAPFPAAARGLAESLASQTAVALTKDRLADQFRGLFEGLIELLVTAIDAKSPYTGAHCRRVPILSEMITEAACASREGPLRDFDLSDAERYELRIAALLHDCGKVTTPVHVQDKATKLEAIFDRIGLVDVRFETVRRDLELAALRARLGPEPTPDTGVPAETLRQLEDDRAFLRRANVGGEFMTAEARQRVQDIAARWRWTDPSGETRPVLDDEEVENLSVSRGTLNAREREIINDHVVATIRMLERLPYPKSLRNVPFIAGCHHEHMDGTGYPNGLVRSQMSTQARILGLADVFEALTAKDRPYKRPMKVRQAVEILGKMTQEGHIDPDLYDLFLREKIHLRYAARYLEPEQIDEELLPEAARFMVAGD